MDRHDSNPWLGLNTYSENDRLFGRDEEIQTVSDIILNNVLTVIYGRSGIGKSSLLRAGVFPRMRYEDFLPVYIRLEHNTEETYLCQIIRKVRDVSDTWNVRQSFCNVDSCQMALAGLLYEGSYRDGQSGLDKQILLVFDQFEEIFTLTDSRHKQDVKDFFCQLATTLNGSGDFADKGKLADFRIVICLREDYLYYLEQNSTSIPSLKRNRYCQALNHGQARDVICNPRPGLVDSGTADAILGKIDHDDSGTIDPAILSLFMHELYEKGSGVITLDNISLYGDNIIISFYEEGMKTVSARSAAFLEDRLVTSDGYRHTLSYSDALSAGMTVQELNTLKDKRIITVEKGDKNQRIIELSHDILCPVVTKNRSERKLKEEAERLEAKNKAIRRRNRVVIAVCAVALAIVAVFACMLVEIRQRQDSMFVAQSRFVAEKAMKLYEEGETVKALALAAEVYPHDTKHPGRPVVKEVTDCLYEILVNTNIGKVFSGPSSGVYSASFSPDGTKIVAASDNGTATIWDADSGQTLHVLSGHSNFINSASFSPDRTKIVTASDDDTAIIWDAETGQQLQTLSGHSEDVNSASFSPDGTKIVTASDDNTAIIWDAETGQPLQTLSGHTFWVNSASFSPDGKKVVTAASDNTAIIWDAESGQALQTLSGHTSWVNSASFSPDGSKIVTASYDFTAIIWNVESGQTLRTLSGHTRDINSASFCPDGTKVMTADDSTIIIWNAESGQAQKFLPIHSNWVSSVSFSPDGTKIVTASFDGRAIIWNTENCRNLQTSYGDFANWFFSSCKTKVVVTSDNNTVIFKEAESGKTLLTLFGYSGIVRSASFSPDKTKVVTVSDDNTAIIWDTESGKPMQTLAGHSNQINSASFNPDGTKVVTASSDGTAIVWDAESGQALQSLPSHSKIVTTDSVINNGISIASFSPDGTKIITTTFIGKMTIWPYYTPQELIDKALSILNGYKLSPEDRRKYYLD